jgi:hypothetical protein
MKRWLGLSLILLVLGLPFVPARAVERAIETAPTSLPAITPLAQLGGLLSVSLPALSAQNLAVPSLSVEPGAASIPVIPAALDTAKAQILMERAAEPAASGPADGAAHGPQEVVRAVNSVLKDFTADDISKMPTGDLHEVSQVIMDQLQGSTKANSLKAVAIIAQARADKMIARRAEPVQETLLNPGHGDNHADMITAKGVPEQARLLRPTAEPKRSKLYGGRPAPPIEKDTVFRHYTTAEGFKTIMESKSLWNGFVPYVDMSPGSYKKTFSEVSGLFFTLPGVKGESVGVPSRDFTHYVDVLLPAKLPLMELEPGLIYMVPLPGRTRDWVLNYYLKWVAGEQVNPTYQGMIAGMDKEGGPGPDLRVPITIVGSGKVR